MIYLEIESRNRISPELKLRKTANEGAKLIGATGGEGRTIGGELLDLGINLRREEGNEQLEDIDSQSIGDDVETLDKVDTKSVDAGDRGEEDPSVEDQRRRFVEQVLVSPPRLVAPLCHGGALAGEASATGIHVCSGFLIFLKFNLFRFYKFGFSSVVCICVCVSWMVVARLRL